MALTFPRAFPATRFSSVEFELVPMEVNNPVDGGEVMSVQVGPSRWRARYEVETLSDIEAGKWRAWLSSLRGAGRTFYGRDPRALYPLEYRASGFGGLTRFGGGSFDGSCSWSVNGSRDVLTLGSSSRLPASFRVRENDYLAFTWDTSKRSLHRILEDVTAVNGVLSVTVESIVDPRIVPNGAGCTFAAPDCVMVLTKVDAPRATGRLTRFSFEAVQRLEP